jgi:hypothetical protein
MDELNKRIIELMVKLEYTNKSAFATALDVSLPVITHITNGRNKPGLDMIQKILLRFKQVSPDWLILGEGNMYREAAKKQDFTFVKEKLAKIEAALQFPETANTTMESFHKLLIDEILHLQELSTMIADSSANIQAIKADVQAIQGELSAE